MANTVVPGVKSSRDGASLENPADNDQRFTDLLQSLPDAVMVHSCGQIVFVNPAAVKLYGARTTDDLVGRKVSQFIEPKYLGVIEKRIERCYSTGLASPPMESLVVACDGSFVDVESVAIPICWNGAPAIEVVQRDIRQRKHEEAAALASQKRLELAEKAGLRIGLWDWDVVANTVTWSDETYRQFGYTRETFSGRVEDALLRVHPDDRARLNALIQQVLDGTLKEYSAEYRAVHPDGKTCWIDAHGVLVRNGSAHMIGIGVDITHLKRIEQSLRDSEAKYRNLFENAMYGVFLAKADGTLLDVNPAIVEMLGYSSKEDLLTRNLERDIYEYPQDRAAILAQARPNQRVDNAEVSWRRKDGKLIRVRLSGGVMLSQDGTIDHFEVIVEDITERRRLEEQYRQSQKLEAVGLLAGGISHDFNNLLGVVLGNADLLLEKTQLGPEQRYVEAIKKAGHSAADLVRKLLAFSRKQVLYPTILDVNIVVRDIGKILQHVMGEDIRIETQLRRDIWAVRADRGQIEQILMNLVTNARDAMPHGGSFRIRTDNAELGQDDVAKYPYVKPGSYVHLAVSDSGTGMSEEVLTRVFEPFFTTKDKGRGTGLGLATVYGIVKQSGGYVWASSAPGAGTTFNIYLPRIDEVPIPEVVIPATRTDYPTGTETVLVLEDDQSLRQVTCEFLAASGYNVLQAGRPNIAIELAQQYKGAIPLVVSDVVLPEMSGPSAVGKLQTLHPEMRALYVSGYAEVPVAQQLIADGATLLQKPVLRMQLLNKVSEMLHLPKS